jgi:muconolactone delta-isomerase
MDYLVTMTTQVPDGVTDSAVAAVRAREAEHTAELARGGRVLRLWRPPLRPGEWRTLGLFTADSAEELEQTLAGMPLRIWRTDTVTPLLPHPNDPGRGRIPLDPRCTEFLTTFVADVPTGTTATDVDDITAREAMRAHELAVDGHLVRLWALSERGRAVGLWQARDAEEMAEVVRSLPMLRWLTVDTVPLTAHPSDPATVAAESGTS